MDINYKIVLAHTNSTTFGLTIIIKSLFVWVVCLFFMDWCHLVWKWGCPSCRCIQYGAIIWFASELFLWKCWKKWKNIAWTDIPQPGIHKQKAFRDWSTFSLYVIKAKSGNLKYEKVRIKWIDDYLLCIIDNIELK